MKLRTPTKTQTATIWQTCAQLASMQVLVVGSPAFDLSDVGIATQRKKETKKEKKKRRSIRRRMIIRKRR